MEAVDINKQNVYDLVDVFNADSAQPSPELFALIEFGVCPLPLHDATTKHFMTTHRILQGFGSNSINDLESYPSRYYDAACIIEAEAGRMNRIMDKITKGRPS